MTPAKRAKAALLRLRWREARTQNYERNRSIRALAEMVVFLEDSCDAIPEFDIDEEWPAEVRHLKDVP